MKQLQQQVIQWAEDKGIFQSGTSYKQAQKTQEETGELLFWLGHGDKEQIKDAIGDICVTIIIQAEMQGLTLEECLQAAYNVISKRKGAMVDGTFVKEGV